MRASNAAPTDEGVLTYSVPPTISGVALKFCTNGGWLSRHRFGSMRISSSKISFESADHSVPSGSVMLRNASGDFARQAIFSDAKFAAVI